MKPCTTCASPLYGDVKYCPFCGNGTTADARTKKTAPAPAAAPVAAAQAAVEEPVVAAPAQRTPAPVAAQASPAAPSAPDVPAAPANPAPAPKGAANTAAKAMAATAPVGRAPTSPKVDTPPPVAKKNGNGKWIVIAVILASLYFYFKGKPDQNEVSCNAAFDAGNKALLAKDIAGARSQALVANGVCTGASRSKLQSLQAAIDAADSVATGCVHSFSAIDGYLDDHKLSSARNALNQLSSTCSADPEAAQDRQKLSAAVAATQAAQATLRDALDAKNPAAAKTAYGQLAGLNRENGDLAALKNELDQVTTEAAAAAAAAEAPAVVATPAEPAPAQPVAPAPVRAVEMPRAALPTPPSRKPDMDNSANVKAEMAAGFLRDAETAMSQKKFDAAKTYVDSARRMDPNNPRLDSMLQQIRDREHQVLQQESTLR